MSRLPITLGLILLALNPLPILAIDTTSELARMCRAYDKDFASEDDQVEGIACMAYVRGYVDSLKLVNHLEPLTSEIPCLPGNFDYEQARLVIMKIARERPEGLHLPPQFMLMGALKEFYGSCSDNYLVD